MGHVLNNHPGYKDAGKIEMEEGRQTFSMQRPRLPFVDNCALIFSSPAVGQAQVEVDALLDSGTDITVFKKGKFHQLENDLGGLAIPIDRHIRFEGKWHPAFDLTFLFPGGASYSSQHRFIRLPDDTFDIGDIWVGQDLLNQVVVIFDGPAGTITITDPNTP